MPRPTIFDVAKVAGVSIKTVSRVVNREPNVRTSTRERVEEAIAVLKYRPDQSARNLASHRSHLIGLVYDDPAAYDMPSGGYILDMQQGALKGCRSAFSELLIHPCDFRKKNVGIELKELIEETRPAGIIVAAPLSNMPKIVRAIDATGTPCVRLSPGNDLGKKCSVSTNDREVSAEMTRYLAGLGHTRIAFIKGNPDHKAVANRFLGYQDGLKESGLEFSENLVAEGDNSCGSGEACAEKLLKRKKPPTAIFAANDDMAAGALRVANRMKIDVPGQLSLAGFDDIALARQVEPALTTIRQPLVQMAERAALMLTKNNNGDSNGNAHDIIPAVMKIRESTGRAPE
ncbi:MAG: LacI family DNA-binding transcriptional regulator [Gammaproteobacteria bacterium]|nr:LacI family DNA-binding transcriptional regulator [Gammaproteobacteria bacterium]MBT8110636.1 LacI family DNA-binding transcriptional regulator [Gammaproteobacteria bacterium]NND46342.1 LacI family DNA-binding transcriptional regulator [Woeseiaceae bacterium]NNL45336.1 LacI family DNA-binding transcriptional regulator [Woeseiaceae bacterium]